MNNTSETPTPIQTTFSLRNRKAAKSVETKNVKNTLDCLILGK